MAVKKKTTKKTTKKTVTKVRKPTAIKAKLTKREIVDNISESTGLTKKQVSAVFDEMNTLMGRSIMKNSVGEFTIPGSFKVVSVKKPARKAKKGINPFTGEATIFKAKPASIAVKIRPLKKLKEFANA